MVEDRKIFVGGIIVNVKFKMQNVKFGVTGEFRDFGKAKLFIK